MRDHLAHRYLDVSQAILETAVEPGRPQIEAAVERLLAILTDDDAR